MPDLNSEVNDRIETVGMVRKKIRKEPFVNTTICIAMSRLAKLEIEKLSQYRPNSDEEKSRKEKSIELLRLFDEFFSLIASQLNVLNEVAIGVGKEDEAAASVVSLSDALEKWWKKNHERVVGTLIGMPVFVGTVGFLGSFGLAPIPMAAATAATATVCFGASAIDNALKIVSANKKSDQKSPE